MRRKLTAFFGVFVAMLLSLVVIVPGAVADTGGKPLPSDPRFRYGFDYYKPLTQGSPAGPSSPWAPQPVNPSVHPSNTGGSWYLNNVKNSRAPAPANSPLTGKLFLPGEPLPNGAPSGTVVKPPSVYKPSVPYAPTAGFTFGRLLAGAGFGLGGVTQTPSNVKDIALSKGVSQGCVDNLKSCTSSEMSTYFSVSNCGHTSTCSSIGAKDANGNAITNDGDWFKQNVTPFLNDLWSKITGQSDNNDVKSDAQIDVTVKGCTKHVSFTDAGNNNGSLTISLVNRNPRPNNSDLTGQAYWDAKCSDTNAAQASTISPGIYQTVCIDKATGGIFGDFTQGPFSDWTSTSNGQNSNKVGLCGNTGSPDKAALFMIVFYNNNDQAYYNGSPSSWGTLEFSMWVNPDPNLDLINAQQTTTSVECTGANGSVFTYTSKVKSVGAFEAPNCPPGFEPTKSSVKSDILGSTGTPRTSQGRTLEAQALDPAAPAKYPLCDQRNGPGCSLSIWVDNTVCRSTRTECQTWVDLSARQPSRVQCHWGTYTMPISDCYGIAEGYKTETGTIFDPKSGTWVGIDTYGNPSAPSPAPWNPANPNPVAGGQPNAPAPTNNPGAFPTTGTQPTSDNCSAPTWSWNPVEFVKNPVVCALKAAFVPQTDIQAQSNALKTKALQTVPLKWGIAPPIVGPGGGGCPNWVVNVGTVHKNVVCGSSFTDAIVGSRGAMFTILASAMVWPLIRSIWYALIPIVRATPSGGSK